MSKHYTDNARKVLLIANQEAQRFNHEYIGTEHVLLAIIKHGSCCAWEILHHLGLEQRKIRLEIEKRIDSGPDIPTAGKLPQTPQLKIVLMHAQEESRKLGKEDVHTEHMLLGLLRESEGVACVVLTKLEVTVESVLAAMDELVTGTTVQEQVAMLEARFDQLIVDVAVFNQHVKERLEKLRGTINKVRSGLL